jgi:hypothetical protein
LDALAPRIAVKVRKACSHLELAGAGFATIFNDFTPTICSKYARPGLAEGHDQERTRQTGAASQAGPKSGTGQRERFMWRDLAKTVRELRRTFGGALASYRPDLHYMRGPGPKWHAKHGGVATTTSPMASPAQRGLHDMAGRRA